MSLDGAEWRTGEVEDVVGEDDEATCGQVKRMGIRWRHRSKAVTCYAHTLAHNSRRARLKQRHTVKSWSSPDTSTSRMERRLDYGVHAKEIGFSNRGADGPEESARWDRKEPSSRAAKDEGREV